MVLLKLVNGLLLICMILFVLNMVLGCGVLLVFLRWFRIVFVFLFVIGVGWFDVLLMNFIMWGMLCIKC